MLTAPLRAPVAVGVKVTLMVQLAPAARLAAQVVVRAKSPLATMLLMVRDAPPGLVKVTSCAALVVPTSRSLNTRLLLDRLTAGVGAVMVAVVVAAFLPPLS